MYIQYNMDQLYLPMDLEEDIPANHLVRVVNDAVNRLDNHVFAAAYPGGGRDSYHPKMLTKIIKLPGTVIADAGYGGEENYAYLEEQRLKAVVKYSTYHKEKSKKWKMDISKVDKWSYDEASGTWQCPGGQTLTYRYESKQRTESGYEIRIRHYRSADCTGCLFFMIRNFFALVCIT